MQCDLTSYELRNGHSDLALAKPRRIFLKQNFKFCGPKLCNSLPIDAIITSRVNCLYSFKNLLKQNCHRATALYWGCNIM